MTKCRLNRVAKLASLSLIVLYSATWMLLHRMHRDLSYLHPTDNGNNRMMPVTVANNQSLSPKSSARSSNPSKTLNHNNMHTVTSSTTRDVTNSTVGERPKEKLQVKLNRIFDNNAAEPEPIGSYLLWNMSDYLSPWKKEYLQWHHDIRQELTRNVWKGGKIRLLVVQPSSKATFQEMVQLLVLLPKLLRMAYETERLLLLDWKTPLPLTDFLVPPENGLDWRCPMWMQPLTVNGVAMDVVDLNSFSNDIPSEQNSNPLVLLRISPKVLSTPNHSNFASPESSSPEEYHDLWRILFTPSDPVRKNIVKVLRWNRMAPMKYTSIFAPTTYGNGSLENQTHDLVECAKKRDTVGPFFVMSDNNELVEAINATGTSQSIVINSSPLDDTDAEKKVEEPELPLVFLRQFVHLYLMSLGRCIVSNDSGDVSALASLIGCDPNCISTLSGHCTTEIDQCVFVPQNDKPYFAKEMPEKGADFTTAVSIASDRGNVSSLPNWMEEYFAWHNDIKSSLDETNWKSTKYLILGCFESHSTCGGISDRLKPLPMIVLEAYRHQRLLLIVWERPKSLEQFLTPPPGGVDWTAPLWLRENLKRELGEKAIGSSIQTFAQAKTVLRGAHFKVAIVFKVQSPTSGEDLFREELRKDATGAEETENERLVPRDGSTFKDVFHHLFRRFFRPVPRIQELLHNKMISHGLVPGEYAAVHLRALYGKRKDRDLQEMIDLAALGVNCASNLLPGSHIFFASDSRLATDAARDYSEMHSLPVTWIDSANTTGLADDPIHLDKDPDWRTRDASAYDSTFVDLYMLAQSRCVAHSNGGYGTFGSLLSYDAGCNMRFFKGRRETKSCSWMPKDGMQYHLAVPHITEAKTSV